MVNELVNRLPADTPLNEIAREIELLVGIEKARWPARRGEGIPAGTPASSSRHGLQSNSHAAVAS